MHIDVFRNISEVRLDSGWKNYDFGSDPMRATKTFSFTLPTGNIPPSRVNSPLKATALYWDGSLAVISGQKVMVSPRKDHPWV